MMSRTSDRTESLFAAAVALPAGERGAYLDEACGGDVELRARLDALLRAHDKAGHLLDRPAAPEQTAGYAGEQPGVVIAGRYKLLEEIGEGGMGTVWVAEQTEPVRRKVAVKLIKAGMDSKSVIARFESERQALAVMDHPNIAKILDGGLTSGEPGGVSPGRPFFVMEYVKGVPITEYCDAVKLSVPERLNLFMQVCSAVQHAHQKGIIHRDLKPSNILVAPYDDKPVPKVIDFGLAKAMHQSLTEKTLHTAHETVLGTPLYMSPEQAQLNNLDVDTRSDIYSLGVLLYEILTGTTPLEKQRFKEAAWDEIRRIIREEEPPRPSARLSSTDTLPSLAACRHTEALKLAKQVRGELDWIVMKALEKDRSRRYETANGFARDVQCYLAGEPVLAHPPSTAYRLRKLVRRNRPQVIAASLVLVALVAGVIGTTLGLVRANRAAEAERLARNDALAQKVLAEQAAEEERRAKVHAAQQAEGERRAKQEALAAKAKAEQAEAETLVSYRASTDDAIEQLIGSKSELGPRERTYLENTAKRWQAFANRTGDDEGARAIRAEGHFRVGRLWQKLGRKQEAVAEYESALLDCKKLAEQYPKVGLHQSNLAGTHYNLGVLLKELGEPEAAWEQWKSAQRIATSLVEQFPTDPGDRHQLAEVHNALAAHLRSQGRLTEAQVEWVAARDIEKQLVAEFPENQEYQISLAQIHNNLGVLFGGVGGLEKYDDARVEYEAARDIQKKLVHRFPGRPEHAQQLARTYLNLGTLSAALEKNEDALGAIVEARDIQKKLVDQFPAVPEYRRELAYSHGNLGFYLAEMNKTDQARVEMQAALDIRKKLVEQFPAVLEYQKELGASYSNFGFMLRTAGKPAESLPWFDLAIRIFEPIHKMESRDLFASRFLFNSHLERARAYDQLHKPAEAAKDWQRAVVLSPPSDRPAIRCGLATARANAGMLAEAVAEVADLAAMPNWSAGQWCDFACVYAVASGKIADKKQVYADRAMELLYQAVKAGYKDAAHMKRNPNLAPLRDRDDFKMLLADLEAAAKPAEKK
jgi:serine/threonine protein kinase/tetratricopeptide (TPR) repeat protein